MRNSEFVAVKVEGSFSEWYSPNYRDPYDDDEDYRAFADKELWIKKPILLGAALGDDETCYISNDLDCLADRICVEADDWESARQSFMHDVETALESGETIKGEIRITPYRRGELPPVNEASLAVYGRFAGLMRERAKEL